MAKVVVDITGNTKKFQKELKDSRDKMRGLKTQAETTNKTIQKGFGDSITMLKGLAMQLGITFGAIKVINYIKEMGSELIRFEKTLTNVYTLLSDMDKKNYGEFIKQGSLDIMAKYGLTVEDTNKALFDTISAGVKVKDSIAFLDQAAKLATGGVTDLSTAVYGSVAIMNAYNFSITEMEKITSAFFTAQKYGVTTVEQLSTTIGQIVPVAKAAGISYQEVLAAMALLTKQGISTDMSATALRATILALTSTTTESEKQFKKLGIETGIVALRNNGLAKTLLQVAKAAEDDADVLTELIPNVRALTGVAALGTDALAEYDDILKDINEDYGDTSSLSKATSEQLETTHQTMQRLTATIRKQWIESQAMNEGLDILTDTAGFLADDLNKEKGLIKTWAKWSKKISTLYTGTIPNLITWLLKLRKAQEQEQEVLTGVSEVEERLAFIKREKAAAEADEVERTDNIADASKRAAVATKLRAQAMSFYISMLLELRDLEKEEGDSLWDEAISGAEKYIKELTDKGGEADDLIVSMTKESYDAIGDMAEKDYQDYLARKEAEKQAAEDAERKKRAIIQETYYTAMNLANALSDFNQAKMNNELLLVEGNAEKQEAIRKKYARKEQTIAVLRSIIAGAQGIVQTGANLGYPLAIPFQIAQAIQTAIQIATIKAQKFATGVLDLQGPGTATSDSIPARLSRHESVMTARETKDYYPYLKAMKDGTFARFELALAERGGSYNLNYDNSNEIKELKGIRELLKTRPTEHEYIQGRHRIIKKGSVTTRISLN